MATSSAFFTAERSPYSLLPFVLDASCTASNTTCSDLMSQLATQIRLGNTCGPDLAKGNPLVTEALAGFQSYNLYREAGCQKSNSTDRVSSLAGFPKAWRLLTIFPPSSTVSPRRARNQIPTSCTFTIWCAFFLSTRLSSFFRLESTLTSPFAARGHLSPLRHQGDLRQLHEGPVADLLVSITATCVLEIMLSRLVLSRPVVSTPSTRLSPSPKRTPPAEVSPTKPAARPSRPS